MKLSENEWNVSWKQFYDNVTSEEKGTNRLLYVDLVNTKTYRQLEQKSLPSSNTKIC